MPGCLFASYNPLVLLVPKDAGPNHPDTKFRIREIVYDVNHPVDEPVITIETGEEFYDNIRSRCSEHSPSIT